MGKRRTSVIGLVLAGAVLAAAAAERHQLVERWKAPEFEYRQFHKVIVIAITDDNETRRTFEDLFVTQLRGRSIDCVTSYSLVSDLTQVGDLERKAILEALTGQQIDGAISVRAAPLKGTNETEWRAAWRKQLDDEQTLRQLIEQTLPVERGKSGKFGLEVALWSVADGKRVWAARTDPYTRAELRKGASEFVQFTMYALEIDDLLKRGGTTTGGTQDQP